MQRHKTHARQRQDFPSGVGARPSCLLIGIDLNATQHQNDDASLFRLLSSLSEGLSYESYDWLSILRLVRNNMSNTALGVGSSCDFCARSGVIEDDMLLTF